MSVSRWFTSRELVTWLRAWLMVVVEVQAALGLPVFGSGLATVIVVGSSSGFVELYVVVLVAPAALVSEVIRPYLSKIEVVFVVMVPAPIGPVSASKRIVSPRLR